MNKIINSDSWFPEEPVTRLSGLTIAEDAKIAAPDGAVVTMTVNGIGTPIAPGSYEGDIVITVTRPFIIPGADDPFLFGHDLSLRCACYVRDGKISESSLIQEIFSGGELTAGGARGFSFATRENDFNGIILENSDFEISDARFELTGSGSNDNYGVGAAIMTLGRSNVTLDNVDITAREATLRAVTYLADDSTMTVKNSRISVESGSRGLRSRCWMMGIRGTNRALQQCDRARSFYENCDIHSDGWGLFSTETTENCSVYVKNSRCDLSGEIARGYGLMSIGNCVDTFDGCRVNVQGYAMIVCEPNARGVITGGSEINASLNAGLIFRNHRGGMTIDDGSVVNTGRSVFVVKGAQTTINCENASLKPGNGVILQLMDNDDVGMGIVNFKPAIDETDVYIEGRDLTMADPDEDVFVNISNMTVEGDFFNSTTNLHVSDRGDRGETPDMPKADFSVLPPSDPDAPPKAVKRGTGRDLQGPKNLDIRFVNSRIYGVISAAVQAYAEGVDLIDIDNCEELGNITQTPAQPVNNGVIVTLDRDSEWTINGTSYLTSLTLEEGARVLAPDGKAVTMTVNGAGMPLAAGTYTGSVVLTVCECYVVDGSADPFLHGKDLPIRASAWLKSGSFVKTLSVPSVITGGSITETRAEGITMATKEDDFTGIIVEDSNFTISNSRFDFTGEGSNDNYGVGAAVLGLGRSDITLDNVEIICQGGVTRALTYVADDTRLTVKNSRIITESGPTTKMSPAWLLGLRGTNRPTQLCDRAHAFYENCFVRSNGWGLFSVEGAEDCSVYVKDSTAILEGKEGETRGYGMMSIGNCVDTLDHCRMDVQGYAFLICNPNSRGVITGGSTVNASVYGAMIFRNHNGRLSIDGGSRVTSGSSMFVVKGSQTTIECDSAELIPGNGVILQLMDNDEPGMQKVNFKPSNDEADVYAEDRDLSAADPDQDVFASFSNMELVGDMYNSTTNLFLQTRGDPGQCPGMPVPDFDLMPKPDPDAPPVRGTGLDLQGAHNLEVSLKNTSLTGVISSATARYGEGIAVIDPENREELSNITQTAAPAVNNGVIAKLDGKSSWVVTDNSYLTGLSLEPGARLAAMEGRTLSMTVDGVPTPVTAGTYTGQIVLSIG